MRTLLFLLVFLSLLILAILLIVKALGRKPVKGVARAISAIIAVYALLWMICYFKSAYLPVALGTDVCFDDWCATLTQIEQGPQIQKQFNAPGRDSLWLILHVRMANHARGIAQKPSEPRIYMTDDIGRKWLPSAGEQRLLEQSAGKQFPLDHKLALHQSLGTLMAFAVPPNAGRLLVHIEEGPFISRLLLPDDQVVFPVLSRAAND